MAQLQEEVHLLRQMKDMLSKDLEESRGGCSADLLSATELRVQLGEKEQELDRAKEALQGQEPARGHVIALLLCQRHSNGAKKGTFVFQQLPPLADI